LTNVEVKSILLEKEKLLRTARAEAKLTRAKAVAESQQIVADAEKQGALGLFNASGITEQEHKIAFAYIRTLMERGDKSTTLDISYLSPDSVLRTKAV
jgi:regulator of protease activity HflC (stomatin/prohibitin superfamily)